jgi:hypothetical protein
MLICHHCGATLAEAASTCPVCGASLTSSGRADRPTAVSSEADEGGGTTPLRIGLALLAVALFGLGLWALVRNSTDHSLDAATTLPTRRAAAADPTPARRTPAASSAEHAHDDSALDTARRMTVAEARAEFEKGTAVLADVRSRDAYNTRHIKNAVLLDEETLHGSLDHLPKDKLIITYCA